MKGAGRYPDLKKCGHYYLKHKKLIGVLVTVMLLASSLGMLLPYFVSRRLIAITDNMALEVARYCAIIMTVIVFHHLFWYLWEKLGSVLTNKVAFDMRSDITKSFLDAELSHIKLNTSGYYLERFNDDVMGVASFLSQVLGIVVDSLTNFSFLIFIWCLSRHCGALFTVGILVLYLIDLIRIRMELKYTRQIKAVTERLSSKLNENFRGIRDIKGLGLKDATLRATDELSGQLSALLTRKENYTALLSRMKTFTQHGIEALLFVYAALILIPRGDITLVILLTIVNYGGFMYDLVGFLAQIKDLFVKGDYCAGRVLQITQDAPKERFGSGRPGKSGMAIEVRDLSYTYEDGRAVLDKLNFTIPGHTAAILVGASGGGKSTLFNLLSGLLRCPDGHIFLGGVDINALSEEALRREMCLVNQETFLLNDTVFNNLLIVRPEASAQDIRDACKKAHIYDEILCMEKGFDTVLQENASNLSGGQKQRLSIARAILRDAPILLLDEPTSAMDAQNQALFLEVIGELKREKTIFMIAHRVGSYEGFDQVIALEGRRARALSAPR